eukprot:TRINITY_DN278_c2_g2_i1.p1 TRINITY_DN278_c2_g2~~TRINITY_DN278_c2_g2_i1.p1  ORF type:complete len:866 (-),score=339.90 TRINITY_DN278_c2_g2_i1:669-3266(-)
MENQRKKSLISKRTIFVGNLPSMQKSQLTAALRETFTVHKEMSPYVALKRSRRGNKELYGFIEFQTEEDVDAVLKLGPFFVFGNEVLVKRKTIHPSSVSTSTIWVGFVDEKEDFEEFSASIMEKFVTTSLSTLHESPTRGRYCFLNFNNSTIAKQCYDYLGSFEGDRYELKLQYPTDVESGENTNVEAAEQVDKQYYGEETSEKPKWSKRELESHKVCSMKLEGCDGIEQISVLFRAMKNITFSRTTKLIKCDNDCLKVIIDGDVQMCFALNNSTGEVDTVLCHGVDFSKPSIRDFLSELTLSLEHSKLICEGCKKALVDVEPMLAKMLRLMDCVIDGISIFEVENEIEKICNEAIEACAMPLPLMTLKNQPHYIGHLFSHFISQHITAHIKVSIARIFDVLCLNDMPFFKSNLSEEVKEIRMSPSHCANLMIHISGILKNLKVSSLSEVDNINTKLRLKRVFSEVFEVHGENGDSRLTCNQHGSAYSLNNINNSNNSISSNSSVSSSSGTGFSLFDEQQFARDMSLLPSRLNGSSSNKNEMVRTFSVNSKASMESFSSFPNSVNSHQNSVFANDHNNSMLSLSSSATGATNNGSSCGVDSAFDDVFKSFPSVKDLKSNTSRHASPLGSVCMMSNDQEDDLSSYDDIVLEKSGLSQSFCEMDFSYLVEPTVDTQSNSSANSVSFATATITDTSQTAGTHCSDSAWEALDTFITDTKTDSIVDGRERYTPNLVAQQQSVAPSFAQPISPTYTHQQSYVTESRVPQFNHHFEQQQHHQQQYHLQQQQQQHFQLQQQQILEQKMRLEQQLQQKEYELTLQRERNEELRLLASVNALNNSFPQKQQHQPKPPNPNAVPFVPGASNYYFC